MVLKISDLRVSVIDIGERERENNFDLLAQCNNDGCGSFKV